MRGGRAVVLVVLALTFHAVVAGQADKWYSRAPGLKVTKLQPPSRAWLIEYPEKDWLATLGGGSTLALLMQKKAEASVVLERTQMNVELGRNDLTDFFLVVEAKLIARDQPGATAVEQRTVRANGRPMYVTQFERPGLTGPDRVRQYSLPIGQQLYRLVCSAPRTTFGRYDAVFSHIAASLIIKDVGE